MSDYAFVADRAKRAYSSVAKIESELERRPSDRALQINLASMRRMAEQAQNELYRLAELNKIEVCKYKISPVNNRDYALEFVASSFLEYQYLFSQIYDSFKNGKKSKAVIGQDEKAQSALNFAYSYSGSLGVVLLAQSEKTFFDGNLDKPIEALYQILDIDDSDNVRDIAQSLGNAVVKRVHDWSAANVKGGFSVDIRWKRSDGRDLAQVIDCARMAKIIGYIGDASEQRLEKISVVGMLVAVSLPAKSFHIVVPGGDSYRGHFASDFVAGAELTVGRQFAVEITIKEKYYYVSDKSEKELTLNTLNAVEVK